MKSFPAIFKFSIDEEKETFEAETCVKQCPIGRKSCTYFTTDSFKDRDECDYYGGFRNQAKDENPVIDEKGNEVGNVECTIKNSISFIREKE